MPLRPKAEYYQIDVSGDPISNLKSKSKIPLRIVAGSHVSDVLLFYAPRRPTNSVVPASRQSPVYHGVAGGYIFSTSVGAGPRISENRVMLRIAVFIWSIGCAEAVADEPPRPPRAPAPRWDSHAVSEIFFQDAFVEGLQGKRPPSRVGTAGTRHEPPMPGGPAGVVAVPTAAHGIVVSHETLEIEIKRTATALVQQLAKPRRIVGQERRVFADGQAWLAALLAIASEQADAGRWARAGHSLSDGFAASARSAFQDRASTDEVILAARPPLQELQGVLAGGKGKDRPTSAESPAINWSQVVPRATLMRRLQRAQDQWDQLPVAAPMAARAQESLRHEAQMVGLVARILALPGMADAEDPIYAKFCVALRDLASDLDGLGSVPATLSETGLRDSLQQIKRNCADCHADYRP